MATHCLRGREGGSLSGHTLPEREGGRKSPWPLPGRSSAACRRLGVLSVLIPGQERIISSESSSDNSKTVINNSKTVIKTGPEPSDSCLISKLKQIGWFGARKHHY